MASGPAGNMTSKQSAEAIVSN